MYIHVQIMKPFQVINFSLYSLKSTENMWFSDAFRGYKGSNVAWNGKMFEPVCCMYVIQQRFIKNYFSFYPLAKPHLKDPR